MDRREFNKVMLGLAALSVFAPKKAEAITPEVPRRNRIKAAIAKVNAEWSDHFEAALIKVKDKFSRVAANPKDERIWYENATKLGHPIMILSGDCPTGKHGSETLTFAVSDLECGGECGGGRWYIYGDYPRMYTDERVPEGFIWAHNEWNEKFVERLKTDAERLGQYQDLQGNKYAKYMKAVPRASTPGDRDHIEIGRLIRIDELPCWMSY